MPLNAKLSALLLSVAALFGTAPIAVADDIHHFIPPKLDYAKICIVERHDDPAPDKPDVALLPKHKFQRARTLFSGTEIVIADPTRAARLLEQVIQHSTSELQAASKYYLGLLLLFGNGVTRDEQRALTLLKEALPFNTAPSAFTLADYYDKNKQFTLAEEYYRQASAAGHARAYLKLSYLYRDGLVPAPSPAAAGEMIGIAQNLMLERLMQGDCAILRDIASLFLTNKYRIRDDKLAMIWLREGEKANIIPSMLLLADAWETGFRGEKNAAGAVRVWKKIAAAGNHQAMYRIGKHLIFSSGNKKDTEALKWLKKAAKRNSIPALNMLVTYYSGGYGSKADPVRMVKWLKKAVAGAPHAPANLFHLAKAYAAGTGTAKDEAKAFVLYEKASAAGSIDALYESGNAHLYGRGTPRNPITSYRFYRLAATHGNSDAILALIKNYQCGIAKPANTILADKWRQRGLYEGLSNLLSQEAARLMSSTAAKDHARAIFLLARWVKQEVIKRSRPHAMDSAHIPMVLLSIAFTRGIGVAKDSARAAAWQRRAIAPSPNQAAGMIKLGQAWLDPAALGINTKKALSLLEQAYRLHPVQASFALGQLYIHGAKGLSANQTLAEKYFRIGADGNNPHAVRRLGMLLLKDPRPERRKEGLVWLRKAAEMGENDAMLKLADYTLRDQTLSKEDARMQATEWLKMAQSYYPCTADAHKKISVLAEKVIGERSAEQLRQAAEAGDIVAMRKIATYLLFNRQTEESLKWYLQAAKNGDALAMLELGNLYFLGIGVEASHSTARKWWQKAAKAGNLEAAGMLRTRLESRSGVAKTAGL